MRILIEVDHPADVHHFKNLYWTLSKKGAEILFAAKNKEIVNDLLTAYKLPFEPMGRHHKTVVGKIMSLAGVDVRLFRIVRRFRPDILISTVSPHSGPVSFLTRLDHIGFADTERGRVLDGITAPFADVILTSRSFDGSYGKKQIYYDGYHELAYLHKALFTPDPSILDELGMGRHEKYVILRFVAFTAYHDLGQKGLATEQKMELVNELSRYATVFISSESQLPGDLEKYKIRIAPEKMHDALAFSSLYVGEGATMASESACLGVPTIYANSIARGYCTELEEKYGLMCNFRDSKGVGEKAVELITTPNIKEEWRKRRDRMLEEKIDVTAFYGWFVENYPRSATIMMEDPDFQDRFKTHETHSAYSS